MNLMIKISILKKIVLVAINSEDQPSAVNAASYNVRQEWEDVVFTNEQVNEVIEIFKDRHPLIADQIASDAGIRLMKRDSDIAEIIISQFTEEWGVWNDQQVPETYSHYADIAMETLMLKCQPAMEKITQLKQKTHEIIEYENIKGGRDYVKKLSKEHNLNFQKHV